MAHGILRNVFAAKLQFSSLMTGVGRMFGFKTTKDFDLLHPVGVRNADDAAHEFLLVRID
jgi:hypothetical protein